MSTTAELLPVAFLDLSSVHAEMRSELDAAWQRVVDRGIFVRGPECELFEAEWAAYCGTAHAIGTGNGLDALSLALRAVGVGPGDEVLVPGHTFIATWLAVDAVGATPVAVDVSPDRPLMDPAAAARAITSRTAAMVPVHLYGDMAPMGELRELADDRGVAIVEDAAQAHGASLDGRRAGSWGDAAAFSFYPGKNLGALGDGGAVTTNDATTADRVRLLANYGSRVKYHHEAAGVNSRLDELQAAILRTKLHRLDMWNARRRELVELYEQSLAQFLPAVSTRRTLAGATSAHHLQVIRTRDRRAIMAGMTRRGIECGIHYPVPPHLSKPFVGRVAGRMELPATEAWCEEVLSLPLGPAMTDVQVDRVVGALTDAMAEGRP